MHKTTLWASKFEPLKESKVLDHFLLHHHCNLHWLPLIKALHECITQNSRPWLALGFSPLLPGSHLPLVGGLSSLVWLFLKFLTGKMGKMKGELAGVSQCGATEKSMVFPAHAANVLRGKGWDTHIYAHAHVRGSLPKCATYWQTDFPSWRHPLPTMQKHTRPTQTNTATRTKCVCNSWLKKTVEFNQQSHLNW